MKLYWVYGRHSVDAVLGNMKRKIVRVVVGNADDRIITSAKQRGIVAEIADINFFNSLFGKNATHQKCAAQVESLPRTGLEDILCGKDDIRPVVILDQITDPQNVGSILRSSAVFDARAVVVQEKHSPELNATSLKVSSGASEIVPVVKVTNLSSAIQSLQKNGFWVVGLDERGSRLLSDLPKNTRYAVVIGAEGKGIRKLTKDYCDFLVKIPGNENFSTLNAAQAATVSLYEIFKLRIAK